MCLVFVDVLLIVCYSSVGKFSTKQPDSVGVLSSIWLFLVCRPCIVACGHAVQLIFFGSISCGTFLGMANAMLCKFTTIRVCRDTVDVPC